MTDGTTTALMRKAYARWAPVYDVVYDKLTEPAARAAVDAAMACGPRVLEAGVGTGLSLGYYPGHAEVYGVDLSEDMLGRAQAKVDKRGLAHVRSLQVMDVTHLTFPDGMFDAVTAQFIITLVPEPEKRPSTSLLGCSSPAARSSWRTISASPAVLSLPGGNRFAGGKGDRLELRVQGCAGRAMGQRRTGSWRSWS